MQRWVQIPPPSLCKTSCWQIGQPAICPGWMETSPGPHCRKAEGKEPTARDFQSVPFPSGFISKGQVKLCLATEMKHLRFVEGQMPEHLRRRKRSLFCWHFRDLCPGTCGPIGRGWSHPREVAYPFLFLLAVPCGRFAVDGPSAARDSNC